MSCTAVNRTIKEEELAGNYMKKLKFPKPKKLNRKTEKRKAREAFKLFIRVRDCLKTTHSAWAGKCYSCGIEYAFDDLDAGHFTQGSHDSTYFDERNVHAQCKKCNRFLHGNLVSYTLHMIEEYGMKTIEELQRLNHQTADLKAQDFHDIYEKYTSKLSELKGI